MTGALPLWVTWGAALGWIAIASSGVCAAWLVWWWRRRKLWAHGAVRRAALGSPRRSLEPSEVGETVTLEGTLRAPDAEPLRRPEDGAPVAVSALVRVPANQSGHPASRDAERTVRASRLELELDDGTRIELEGEVDLRAGSSETLSPRSWELLGQGVRERVGPMAGGLSLERWGAFGFRSVGAGDRVVARGELDRRPKGDDGDYRAPSVALRLVPMRRSTESSDEPNEDEPNEDEPNEDEPIAIAAAEKATPRWPDRGGLIGVALAGALASFGGLALAAEATEDGRDPYAGHLTARVRGAEYHPHFDDPPAAFIPALLTITHREDALRDLARRYEMTAPTTERAGRAAFEARSLLGCDARLSSLMERGRYAAVLAAGGCDEERFWVGRAALAVGDTTRAADTPSADAATFVVERRWADAAAALAGREQSLRETLQTTDSEGGRAWASEQLALVACLRRSFARRAGGDERPRPEALNDPRCRAAWVDALPADEGRALLREPSAEREAEVLRLLWVEAGRPLPVASNLSPSLESFYDGWMSQVPVAYTGLHASARRAWDRTPGRSPTMGARLYAQAALFEAASGDLERATGFATRALALVPPSADAIAWRAPASVLVYAALRRGDVDEARRVLGSIPPSAHHRLEGWVDLFGGRHELEGGEWLWRSIAGNVAIEAARVGDGQTLAFVTALQPHHLLTSTALLAPLIREGDRDVLATQARWTRRYGQGAGLDPRRQLRRWSSERGLAEAVGDEERARTAARYADRFRSIVMDRETAVPLLLLDEL